VLLSDDEVPTVIGRRVTTLAAVRELPVPEPGEARTGVYLETVRQISRLPGRPFVLGGMIGPFSLAARLLGVSEALSLTLEDPALAHELIGKATAFLIAYARAFQSAGADGVLMAEPTAGLLSPRALAEFSSAAVREIAAAVDRPEFTVILHNCAARLVHLPHVLTAGVRALHFGAPMDLAAALAQVPETVLVCGNLDPSRVFVQSAPEGVSTATRALLEATAAWRHHVPSSGCDLPPQTPLANVDAFLATVREGVR
jgi:uroporphyrinogen decarboxylase